MNYIYENLLSDEQVTELHNDKVFPLIRELYYKYGLKAIMHEPLYARRPTELGERTEQCRTVMAFDDGLAVCTVYYEDNEYCYHSPYYRKERGHNEEDRHTLRSKKLSSLMGVLKKRNVVPRVEQVRANSFEYNIQNGVEMLRRNIRGATSKNVYDMDVKEIHALLRNFFGEPTQVDIEKCKIVLDKYNEADKLNAEREKEIEGFFFKEFYVVGVNRSEHLVIGSVKCVKPESNNKAMEVQIVKPLKRMRTLDECEHGEVKAALLMTKVIYEHKEGTKVQGIPYTEHYNPDLGIIFTNRRVGRYDHAWSFIPCATTSASSPQSSANTTLTYTE